MTSQDILFYTLSIAIWIFIGLSIYLAVALVRLIEHLKTVTKTAFDIALNYQLLKNGLKAGVLGVVQKALNNLTK
jgi:hypothetical protein